MRKRSSPTEAPSDAYELAIVLVIILFVHQHVCAGSQIYKKNLELDHRPSQKLSGICCLTIYSWKWKLCFGTKSPQPENELTSLNKNSKTPLFWRWYLFLFFFFFSLLRSAGGSNGTRICSFSDLRKFALSPGGFVHNSIRKLLWPQCLSLSSPPADKPFDFRSKCSIIRWLYFNLAISLMDAFYFS